MKKKELLFLLILSLTLFGIYWKTFNYELIWDSKIFFKNNRFLLEDKPLYHAFELGYFKQKLATRSSYYRPITVLTFLLEEKIWGLKNMTMRLVNLMIYILSLLFIYFFLKNQSLKENFAEIATLLFALFPLNSDNIIWVVGRCDLLLLLWAGMTIYFLDLYLRRKKNIYLLYSSFGYVCGLLSKEAFFFFLPIFILYEFLKRKKITFPYHLSLLLITASFFFIKTKFLGIKNLRIVFHSNLLQNLFETLSALGFYLKSIFFPLNYDMFLPLWEITNSLYIGLGILFLLLLGCMGFITLKKKELMIPLSLIVFFLAGHIILIFTLIFPFKVYTRYMMIPVLGFVWIFTHFMVQIKEKLKFLTVMLLLLLFIPAIVIHSYNYRTELSFFQRALKSSPQNSFILYSIADIYYEKGDYLLAELYLNRALSYKMEKQAAMLITLRYADIEFIRAKYDLVIRWIESLKAFYSASTQIGPYILFHSNHQKALVYMNQGKFELAESAFQKNIQAFEEMEDSYKELYTLYVGHNFWDKAKDLEAMMKTKFPFARGIETPQLERHFKSLSPEEKLKFYILHKNFIKGIEILEGLERQTNEDKILLARLYYRAGKEKEGEKLIHEIYSRGKNDYQLMNTLGNFYLREFLRVEEALYFFRKSLELNPSQPDLIFLTNRLIHDYLEKLKKVWY